MKKRIALALAVGLAVTCAPGASAAVSLLIPPAISLNGGISPAHLSKTTSEPVTLNLAAKIARGEASSVPATKTLSFSFDRNGAIFTKGLATCSEAMFTAEIDRTAAPICQQALIGEGQVEFEIEFPGQPVYRTSAPLEIFNGVLPGRQPALIYVVHAHVPAPTTYVTAGALERTRGRFGTRMTIPIPKIVDGLGWVSRFQAQLGRSWSYEGRRVSLLSAHCPTGSLTGEAKGEFVDGTVFSSKIVKPCGQTASQRQA